MMTIASFNQRSIAAQNTLGERLQQARVARNWSVQAVAQELKIKADYITAIEESRYTELPSAVFVKSYVRNYAKLLRLSRHEIEEQLDAELQVYNQAPEIPTLRGYLAKQPLQVWQLVSAMAVILLILGAGLYTVYEVTSITQPPEVTIQELPQRVGTDQPFITITGSTTPEASVQINQQPVPVKSDGTFSQNMTLQLGTNVFKIVVKTKRSKEQVLYKQVFVGEALTEPTN